MRLLLNALLYSIATFLTYYFNFQSYCHGEDIFNLIPAIHERNTVSYRLRFMMHSVLIKTKGGFTIKKTNPCLDWKHTTVSNSILCTADNLHKCDT